MKDEGKMYYRLKNVDSLTSPGDSTENNRNVGFIVGPFDRSCYVEILQQVLLSKELCAVLTGTLNIT